jgi:hypothetical protein
LYIDLNCSLFPLRFFFTKGICFFIKGTLQDFGFGNDFLDMILKAQATQEKINLTSPKFKTFGASKNTMKRAKRQLMEWEKIFASHISDQRLISKIYKELLQFNNENTNNPIEEMDKRARHCGTQL